MTVWGTAGASSEAHAGAVNAAKVGQLAGIPARTPGGSAAGANVAASERTQTRRTVPPPSPSTQDRQRTASWICWVNGPGQQDRAAVGGGPRGRSRFIPRVLVHLDCARRTTGPRALRRGGRPAASRVAATNDPYMVSLSSSAGTGSRPARAAAGRPCSCPHPAGPATTPRRRGKRSCYSRSFVSPSDPS